MNNNNIKFLLTTKEIEESTGINSRRFQEMKNIHNMPIFQIADQGGRWYASVDDLKNWSNVFSKRMLGKRANRKSKTRKRKGI